jgi:Methyltransferase domain
MTEADTAFEHSMPALYDRCVGPLLFEPYAKLVAERATRLQPARILETAAGTGIVTRAVAQAVPEAEIVATDVNPAVLEFAKQRNHSERVTFQPADAEDLPFAEGSFDLVLCQFGVMFFPRQGSRGRGSPARGQIRRQLPARHLRPPGAKPGTQSRRGRDRCPVSRRSASVHGARPVQLCRSALIEADLRAAGFTDIELETVALSSRVSARDAAEGMVLGSPFRAEIERRDPTALDRAANAVAEALRPWDGKDASMSAHVLTATK